MFHHGDQEPTSSLKEHHPGNDPALPPVTVPAEDAVAAVPAKLPPSDADAWSVTAVAG